MAVGYARFLALAVLVATSGCGGATDSAPVADAPVGTIALTIMSGSTVRMPLPSKWRSRPKSKSAA